MSATALPFARTVGLGAIAGLTIFLGLPVGRLRVLDTRVRVALAMFSVGILAFIFMDVGSHAETIIAARVRAFDHDRASFGAVAGLFALLALGFGAGSAGLTAVEHWLRPSGLSLPPLIGGSSEAAALAPSDGALLEAESERAQRGALHMGMMVAVAIGLHNFAEGLAIGVSAATGAIGLATVLIIGFAAHNATEGFGIVGPLGQIRPSWRWLALAGIIGGGPTFLGTVVGYQLTSSPLELLFYALAAGALIYVIGEIWTAMRHHGHREMAMAMAAAGFLAGVLTDLIVTYGGG